jgi:hypothetical protein
MFQAGGVAQAVKHLPSKSEVLSSNSSATKKKKYLGITLIYWTRILEIAAGSCVTVHRGQACWMAGGPLLISRPGIARAAFFMDGELFLGSRSSIEHLFIKHSHSQSVQLLQTYMLPSWPMLRFTTPLIKHLCFPYSLVCGENTLHIIYKTLHVI